MTTTHTTQMQAVRLLTDDGPDGIAYGAIPMPVAKAGEALVRVRAAAITRDELTWRADSLPAIPSYELSGVIDATGEEVFALTPFDRDGVASEFAAVPMASLAPKPASLSHAEAAALPLPGLSAWQGLFDHGRLQPGERVLIHGAAGGVGSLAVQIAHAKGAHVTATASPGNIEFVRSLGADVAIDYTKDRFEDAGPFDVVFDTAGGERLERSTAVADRVVTVAHEAEGAVYFVVKPDREQLTELARLADSGALRPLVAAVFPLADAKEAFRESLNGGRRGKVVLEVSS
jgi:NADPH:quinone reductase-like Zn-dependent oxidoreductase